MPQEPPQRTENSRSLGSGANGYICDRGIGTRVRAAQAKASAERAGQGKDIMQKIHVVKTKPWARGGEELKGRSRVVLKVIRLKVEPRMDVVV